MSLSKKKDILNLTLMGITLGVLGSGCFEMNSGTYDYYDYQGPVMMAEFDCSENQLSFQRSLTADFGEFVVNRRMAVHDVYEITNGGMQDISLKGTYDQIACIKDMVPAVLKCDGSQMDTSLTYVYDPQIQKYRSYEEYRAFFDSFEDYEKPSLGDSVFTCTKITLKDRDQKMYCSFPEAEMWKNKIWLYGMDGLEQHIDGNNVRYLFNLLKSSDVFYVISEQKESSEFEILKQQGEEYLPADNYSIQTREIGPDELTELLAHQFSEYDFETVKCVTGYYLANPKDNGLPYVNLSDLFFPYLGNQVCIRHNYTLTIPAGKTVRMTVDLYKGLSHDIRVEHVKNLQYAAEIENKDSDGYSADGLQFDVRQSEVTDELKTQKGKSGQPVISIVFTVKWPSLE